METFIKKAIEGEWRYCGWQVKNRGVTSGKEFGLKVQLELYNGDIKVVSIEEILLDPLAWKAVGKDQMWGNKNGWGEVFCETCKELKHSKIWQHKMHQMIDHLAEGKDIESYITSLFE